MGLKKKVKKKEKGDAGKEKEEPEKKTNEEEEKLRILAEKEEAERRKMEKLMIIERKQQELRERKQRVQEIREIEEIMMEDKRYFKTLFAETKIMNRWARYMRCDGTPDPSLQKEINTYISLSHEGAKNQDVEIVLKNSLLNLDLMDELNEVITMLAQTEELTDYMDKVYQEVMVDMQNLQEGKLNDCIHNCLLDALRNVDPETANYQAFYTNHYISMCIWGNFCKNLRIKSFEFKEFGFSFDIPKVLALADCAITLLHTTYDYLSDTSPSFRVRRKVTVDPSPVVEPKELLPIKEEKPEEEVVPEPPTEEEGTISEDMTSSQHAVKLFDEAAPEDPQQIERKKTMDEIEISEFPLAPSPEPVEYEEFEGDIDAVDLRCFQAIGGIFYIYLLYLPPQPKVCGKWTITEVVPTELSHMDYVADPPKLTESYESTEEGDHKKEKESMEQRRDEKPQINITLRIPPDVVLSEYPHPVKWDKKSKLWTMKEISDYKYNEETKSIQFKTNSFGIFSLVQDTHINMPFQSWELKPNCTNGAVLTIIAAVLEISIEIKDGKCSILKHSEEGLGHILGKWYKPKEFIKKLKNCGINLFPEEDSTIYVSTQVKSSVIEEHCYQQMAMVASSMAFSWSRWNCSAESNQMIVQSIEALTDDDLCNDWLVYMITKTHVMKLKLDEFDPAFSVEPESDYRYFSNFYHLVQHSGSKEAVDRLLKTTPEFRDCVRQMLSATKVLTYS